MYSFRCWLSQWWTMPKGLQPYGRPFSGRRSSSYMHYKHSFPWYQLTSTHCCGYVNITFMCGRAGRPSFDDIGTVITMTRKDTVHLYENLLIGCETVESRRVHGLAWWFDVLYDVL
ncbi:hypothetical protein MKW98_011080 [Papaver atlanticum]|uniref:Uncharacterized protein n=1 Tax=Papaver atlanticum TaxID=357466 RepID=A0AAD4XXN7_9MAGN|nr:hypothetical protein MKW98_011080 [Papaver atlanticum]